MKTYVKVKGQQYGPMSLDKALKDRNVLKRYGFKVKIRILMEE